MYRSIRITGYSGSQRKLLCVGYGLQVRFGRSDGRVIERNAVDNEGSSGSVVIDGRVIPVVDVDFGRAMGFCTKFGGNDAMVGVTKKASNLAQVQGLPDAFPEIGRRRAHILNFHFRRVDKSEALLTDSPRKREQKRGENELQKQWLVWKQ